MWYGCVLQTIWSSKWWSTKSHHHCFVIEAKKEERVWDKCKLNLFKYKKMVKYRFNVSFYEWIKIYINSDGSSSSNECDTAVCSKRYSQVSGGIPSPIVDLLLTKETKRKRKRPSNLVKSAVEYQVLQWPRSRESEQRLSGVRSDPFANVVS